MANLKHIDEAIADALPQSYKPSSGKRRKGNKQSIFTSNTMCPCGRVGRFHDCSLGTEDEPAFCERCGGLGRYVANPDLWPGHPDYYTACVCPPSRRRGDWQLAHRRIVDALNEISQAPDREMTFDNFDVAWPADEETQENLKALLRLAQGYAADPLAWSLTLFGTYGCGKTHLGRAMQLWRNDIANSVAGAAFVVVPDLLDYIKATFSQDAHESYDQRFDRIRNAPFLILDDIGAEKATDWADEKLFQIFNWRYNHGFPTVVLTNIALEDLEPRIASRLHEGIVYTVTAGDYRLHRRSVPTPSADKADGHD